MQAIINNFIRKNLRISDARIYLPPKKGGLGFFDLKKFLGAQRCTWLLRAKKNCIDNWRYDLHKLSPNNDPLQIRASDVSAQIHPVLHDICIAYEDFYFNFCKSERNYKSAQIFENSIFRDPGTGNMLGKQFFGIDFYNGYRDAIRKLSFDDCFANNVFKSIQEFRDIGLPLSLVVWMRIRNTLLHYGNPPLIGKINKISDFVDRWRKGGKQIRRVSVAPIENNIIFRETRSFITFSSLAGIAPARNHNLESWCSSWNTHSLNNELRNFIFSTRFNCLPLNNRLNAYLDDVDPACTYCTITKNLPPPRDSLSHCFFYCDVAQNFLQEIANLINLNTPINCAEFQEIFWYGINGSTSEDKVKQLTYLLIFDCFRYVFFKNRQRRHLPTSFDFTVELLNLIKWISRFNNRIKLALINTFPNTIIFQAIG
jgi:hypothetical protein